MKDLSRALTLFIVAHLTLSAALGPAFDDARQSYLRMDYKAVIGKLKDADDPASLLLVGQSYIMIADYKQATATLEKAIDLDPANSDAHLWLGRAYGHRAENAFPTSALRYAIKTREHFEKSVALNPNNLDALDDLFEFYLQAPGIVGGGTDKAAKLIDPISKRDPAEGASDRGRLAEQKKDYATAEKQFRIALQIAPPTPRRQADLNRLLAKRKAAGL